MSALQKASQIPNWKDEGGQTMVLVALCMVAICGFLALAVDVGLMFRVKRQVQIAADAASVAGALDWKFNGNQTSAQNAGIAAATANGFTHTAKNGVTVTVKEPPVDGPNTAASGYVEAIISAPAPTFFMGAFTPKTFTVSARAVTGGGNSQGCVWALAKSGVDVSVTGSGTLSSPNCDLYDDSSSSNALTLTGSGSIRAKAIAISGNYSKTGSGSISPTPTTGVAPAADPLAGISPPTIPTGTCSSSCTQSFSGSGANSIGPGTYNSISNTGSGSLTLTPGNYIINGNLSNTGSGSLILGAGNYTITGNFTTTGSGALTLGAGNYIVEGNLSLTGSGALTGIGVTFFTEGSTTVTGSGSMDLEAPTSGTYDGVMFFQSRSDTQTMSLTGSGSANFKGIVYAPNAPITLTGSGSWNIDADFISDSITLTGSGSITDTSYQSINSGSVLSRIAIVE